jgi:hypothetical protein|tara:strand:+ start:465 stop:638 length:174 start_codon:yes stop_codon:yes gene_type:complete
MDTIDLLTSVANSFSNTYQSVTWLDTPLIFLDGHSPAELIRQGEIDKVYNALQNSLD